MRKIVLMLVLISVICLFAGCGDIKTVDNVIIDTEGMTNLQKAIVITAESYYLRGARAQYDQKSFTSGTSRSVGRRTTGILKPEDYTTQSFSYHDCSSFVFDVYYNALGIDFSDDVTKRSTKYFIDNKYSVLKEYPQEQFSDLSSEEIEKKKQEFRECLQPGDIIVYRKKANKSGHAMLYVGNDKMIHSSGADYSPSGEKREKNGTYLYESVEEKLLTPGSARYLMTQYCYTILRPLNAFTGEIPDDTVSRIGKMRGIVAEKLSYPTYGQSVNLGQEITFTFHIENHSEGDKTLKITDTVPKYTEYVSGAEGAGKNKLEWNVTVPAGETVEISYKVKVKEDKSLLGFKIQSESTIESVALNCREIVIGSALTGDEQKALVSALENRKNAGVRGVDLINSAYKDALGYEAFPNTALEDLNAQVFRFWGDTDMDIDKTLPFSAMVANRLYGGKWVVEQVKKDEDKPAMNAYRVRLLEEHLLLIGDVITADNEAYIYTGEALINVANGEEESLNKLQLFGLNMAFAVLRPSIAN